jgi:lipopolysaccharide/colanic/teichoic acid biosynthesis glycosyltransferase
MLKRLFDIIFSSIGIIILSPILLFIGLWVLVDSPGGIFFRQVRVGKKGTNFRLFKFRSMRVGSEAKGQLTVGAADSRITPSGLFIRKYKVDELPQLLNVLIGDMSLVGPRPEVPRYVAMYNAEQRRVLEVRPGITDFASIEYVNENELLAKAADPEKMYIEEIMPAKLKLNLKYIQEQGLATDFSIIFSTLRKIVS